jgi:hypothetical protein
MAKKIIRIILSLLGVALGVYAVINNLQQEPPDYIKVAISAAIAIFSVGWLFNLRFAKIVTGILFIPAGAAGALWTVWDFIQEVFFGKGIIGNIPLLGNNLTIFLLPNILVLVFFVWIVTVGFGLVKGKKAV